MKSQISASDAFTNVDNWLCLQLRKIDLKWKNEIMCFVVERFNGSSHTCTTMMYLNSLCFVLLALSEQN